MAVSPLVPGRLPVGVEDHAYMIEPSGFKRETVQVLRQQADQSSEPGEQCVDETTEILSARGWLTYDELRIGDQVLTLNHKTGLSQWQPVEAIHTYFVEKRRMRLLEGKLHSSLTTLDHRWPVLHDRWHKESARILLTSAELRRGDRIQTSAECASLPTEPKYSDELVELAGWFWTEGNYSYGAGGRIRRVTIAQSHRVNPSKTDRIRACVTRLLGPERRGWWYEYRYDKKGMSLFQFTPEAAAELIDVMGSGKTVPPTFLTSLTSAQLELFIEVSVLGDGNVAAPGRETYYLFQKSEEMLSSFQMALTLAGWRNSMIKTPKGWRLAFSRWTRYADPVANARDRRVLRSRDEIVDYSGAIWCPTTQNETWLARRRGTVYFTGNSLNPQGLWRRSQESWHHGAGQDFLDGKDEKAADPHRYRASKGIDPWTRGQVSLLHPTLNSFSTTNTNLHLAVPQDPVAGVPILYVADGNQIYGSSLPYNLVNTLALMRGTGWTATGATIAATTTDSFRLTSTGAVIPTATSPTGTGGFPVEAGRQYGAAFSSANISGAGGVRIPTILVTWYTAAGATISSTTAVPAVGAEASTAKTTVIAPASAAFVSVTISWTAAWSAGDVHEATAVSIGPADLVSTLGYPLVWYSADIQAGQAPQTVQSIATNGSHLWAALGTSGLHRHVAGTGTSVADVPAAPASGQISLVGYANGFLLAAGSAGVAATRQNSLWLVSDPLGTPTLGTSPLFQPIKTHPNPNFVWTGIAGGRSVVYAFGNSGGNGEVYKITFDPNTGTLSTAASPATALPDGETIHALTFYAGGIILGTGKGLRLGQADGGGNIDYGPLIETDWPVRCLEPQDRYCWFGWTKYDASNSGLGRVDLGFFTDNLTPAWASDLMTADTSTGDVVAAVTLAPYGYTADQRPPVRVFTVAGEGVYIEDPGSRVASGTLDTGTIRFSTSEPKTARSLDIRHHALPAGGTVVAEMQRDGSATWTSVGTSSTAASYGPAVPLDLQSLAAEALEFRLTLTRPTNAGTDFTQTVELTRWTAKVLPTPSTIDETFTIPLIMRREVVDNNDANYRIDVAAEVAYLKGLERSRALVTLQFGSESHTVYLLASEFQGQSWAPGKTHVEGILNTQWQTVRG